MEADHYRPRVRLILLIVIAIIAISVAGLIIRSVLSGDSNSESPVSQQTSMVTQSPQLPTRITTQPPSAPPSPQALDIALQWGKAFVNHSKGITTEQWLAGMRPFTTEDELAIMAAVDPEKISATEVTGTPQVKRSYLNSVEVILATNGETLSMTLINTHEGWRVAFYEQAATSSIPSTPAPNPRTVPVRVFNNAKVADLGARAANDIRADGWNVVEVGNYSQGAVPTTTAYFRPGTEEESAARALAAKFTMRAEPRVAGIQDAAAGVIVMITNDYASK